MGIHRQVPDAAAAAAPALPHAVDRHPRVRGGVAFVTLLPGQAEFLGQHVRLRRDALVHDRSPGVIRLRARHARLRATVPGPGQRAHPRVRLPLFADRRRLRDRRSRSWSSTVLNPDVAAAGLGWLLLRDGRSTCSTGATRGSTSSSTHKVAIAAAGGRPRGGVRLGAGADRRGRLRRAGDGDGRQAGGAQAARDPRGGLRDRAAVAADRRAHGRGGVGRGVRASSRRRSRAAGACRAMSSACGPARPGGASSRRRSTCARRRS